MLSHSFQLLSLVVVDAHVFKFQGIKGSKHWVKALSLEHMEHSLLPDVSLFFN
jgi:hypothetical protein